MPFYCRRGRSMKLGGYRAFLILLPDINYNLLITIYPATKGALMSSRENLALRSTVGSELSVNDVMTRDVISIGKFDSVMAAADILSGRNISGLPVVDKEKKVTGIITQADILSMVGVRKEHTFKDLLKHALGEPLPERRVGDIVADVMTTPVLTTRPQASIAEVVQLMDEKKIRRMPVVDDGNRLIGIISRADILKAVLRKLK